jgi:redoxin
VASVQERYGPKGVTVVGVHSPEFENERVAANIRDAVRRLGVRYPVVLDTDWTMWDALGNEAWPSLYLVDKKGRIRDTHVGEIHAGTRDARRLEESIEDLLGEPAPAGSAATGSGAASGGP